MVDEAEIRELCRVYREMDEAGKKKMVRMAGRFLTVQGKKAPPAGPKERAVPTGIPAV
ncbi:MAG: hypothetical protein LBR23_00030 [Spirochaetaceae bacterium]|jgi:hypothetical protein|nr:hypothetical protein [Spirochaetaceae bacterium]